jgi:uncharacterized protein YndB with AHSA1/START domain
MTAATISTASDTTVTQINRIYIKTTPQAIWDAITKPEWTARYGYTGYVDYDLRPGGHYVVRATEEFRSVAKVRGNDLPEIIIEGEVLVAEPPHKLVTTFHMLMDPTIAAEPFTRITPEITEVSPGLCSLTLTHELDGSPMLASIVSGSLEEHGAGGGHAWVLSDLKTLLETGSGFTA